MIFLDSRYATASLFKAWDARKQQYNLTAFRRFPSYTTKYFIYQWVETDRLDNVANKFLNNPNFWHKILDINPEIIDPTVIEPGTLIRIPNA
jgi:hypothetical protein